RQILKSATIVCTVPDARKAVALKQSLKGPVTPDVPASILQMHPDCHIFTDTAGGALLEEGK
ncbi:MAG: glucosamine-6-phosphate deaminase, partial [Verrucomicrobiota bacterium]|nr:glucosamine-6-phosphate deaminase [Verrucomicrobiota bacterium]